MNTMTGLELGTKRVSASKILAGITIFILLGAIGGNISPNFAMAEVSNSTSSTITPLPPVSGNFGGVNETTVGDQISDFVHHAIQIFKQQREETVAAIKQCHTSLANAAAADRGQIMDNCKSNLRTLHDKFSDERTKYHELFAQFREHMHVFLKEAHGLPVDPAEKKQALDHIMNARHQMMMEGKQDVLQGMRDIMKGHAMINSGHPMMGQEEIEKGKHQIGQGMHDIGKSK